MYTEVSMKAFFEFAGYFVLWNILKAPTLLSSTPNYISRRRPGPSFGRTCKPFIQESFVPSLDDIGAVVLEK